MHGCCSGTREWTPQDYEFLRANAASMKVRELAKVLGRTEISVRVRASRLRIRIRHRSKYFGVVRKPELLPTGRPSELDLAWAAGFLEGEGSFRNAGHSLQVKANQASTREPLERLQTIFGGSICPYSCQKQRDAGRPWNDGWNWIVCGGSALQTMQSLRPLLSQRRQGQIDAAISNVQGARWQTAISLPTSESQ